MFAAVILLILMIVTVAMFEVTVNNRHRAPKPPVSDKHPHPGEEGQGTPGIRKS